MTETFWRNCRRTVHCSYLNVEISNYRCNKNTLNDYRDTTGIYTIVTPLSTDDDSITFEGRPINYDNSLLDGELLVDTQCGRTFRFLFKPL